MFKFSERSLKALEGVHPVLVAVAVKALRLSEVDFTVIEGVRTLEKQREYVARGASKTMKSKHLLQPDGYGYAIDVYPFYYGRVQCEAGFKVHKQIAEAMKAAADEMGVRITWGGDWKTFCDAPHFQLESF